MQFDDRLATVLRTVASSEAGARTQFRQLLDLLGSMPAGASSDLSRAGYDRLAELCDMLPPSVQSAILRAPGLRLRNRALVAWLAQAEPQTAAAAMATAELSESAWLYLIPRLPLRARGFLRHRRDLPFSARQVLERLGVRDLVLPEPVLESLAPDAPVTPAPDGESVEDEPDAGAGIGALVRRIEAFQRARRHGGTAPRLPLGEDHAQDEDLARRPRAFDFATDASGAIVWADPAMAPLVVGLALGPPHRGAVAMLDAGAARAMAGRQPLRAVFAELAGPPDIAGRWRIDAAPAFSPLTGQFAGYEGRMRRPAPALARRAPANDGSGDRMRQLLHELRTPVNAIQGFAELIQQQMFGSAPNEYRALAAAIAVDAARLMAGFDEIDRLARLETGALQLGEGECDLRQIVQQLLQRLDGVLRPRSARIELAVGPEARVAMEANDAKQLCWRLLATLAGALAPGEIVDAAISADRDLVVLEVDLPTGLAGNGDPFAASVPAQRAVSAGMFGTGFTLRLARAEAEAAGGSLATDEDRLRLVLPALTGTWSDHTVEREGNGGAAA